jgi:hypothetical protein
MKTTKRYVYQHRRLDNNDVFYVGSGTCDKRKYRRAKDWERCNEWKKIILTTDFAIEIVADRLSVAEAHTVEMSLIFKYGRIIHGTGSLVNIQPKHAIHNLKSLDNSFPFQNMMLRKPIVIKPEVSLGSLQ